MFRRGFLLLLSTLITLGYFASGRAVSAEQPTVFATALPTVLTTVLTSEFPMVVTVQKSANVRAGPGTEYEIISAARAGQRLSVLGCNADCSWYQLANDCWIAAFLVKPEQPVAATSSSLQLPTHDARLPTVIVSIPITVPNAVTQTTRCPQTIAAVNTYAGPGTSYPVAEVYSAGECLAVVGRNTIGDWLQLSHGMWILTAAIQYVEPVALLPITDRVFTATPVPPPTPLPTATPTLVPTPTSNLSEILTVGEWVIASQEQKAATALLWTLEFVNTGMGIPDPSSFAAELLVCVDTTLEGTAAILGASYLAQDVAAGCALLLKQ